MHPAILIFLVFAGCCTNVITLEFLIQAHPGSGNIVTFAQFLFIAVEGFIFEFKFGSKKSVVPMKNYILMVSMFFVTSAINNYSLNFNISMPLHMIFKSGSLIANMTLGIFILKRSYKPSKYVAVVVVTIGIVICSLMSATEKQTHNSMEESPEIGRWLIGISMLTFALFASARLGIFQEQIYAQYGKHPKEALFYNHALPLPAFALLSHHIYDHAVLFSASEPVLLPVIGWSIPKLWLILLFNVITQYICIRAVFVLTSECQSLTVTLVITLRKFLSLLFSVFYFQNPFTPYHWFGTFLVFGGTLLFLDIFSLFQQSKPKELKTQYYCIRFIFDLASHCQSLTVTMVCTVRKFLSILFSVYYFENPFTVYHWLGTSLVFAGTLLFFDVSSLLHEVKSKGTNKNNSNILNCKKE